MKNRLAQFMRMWPVPSCEKQQVRRVQLVATEHDQPQRLSPSQVHSNH